MPDQRNDELESARAAERSRHLQRIDGGDEQAPARTGGGRSENNADERDSEQKRAGYPERDWNREQVPYSTVRSEPQWDPSRSADSGGGQLPSERAGYQPQPDWYARNGTRESSDLERDPPPPSLTSAIGEVGRSLVRTIRRLVHGTKN